MRRPKSAVLLSSDYDVEAPSKKACKGEPSSVTGRGKVMLCAIAFCQDYRVGGKPCCKLHVRTYDSFRYQVNAAAENGDNEMMEAWERMLADEARLVVELTSFARENLPNAKYKRKQLLADASFKKRNLRRKVKASHTLCQPMRIDKFLIRAKNECGFSDSQAKALFKLYETVDRDDTDWMIRQWGIIKEFSRTRTKDVIENMVDHESSKIKNAKDQDLLMLQTHAIQQEMSFQDQWFHKMRGAAEAIEKKAKSKKKNEAELLHESEIPSAKATLFMVQERQLSQLKLDVCKALRANELVMANIEHPQGLMADRAAASLLNKLAMQNQLLCRIEGAHPGASMEKLSGSKLEPLETNSVEALSLDDVYVASVVATIVEESGAGASGAPPCTATLSDDASPVTPVGVPAPSSIASSSCSNDSAAVAGMYDKFLFTWTQVNPRLRMEPFLKKYLQFKPFKADISDVRTLAGLAGINNEMMDEGKVLTPEVFEKTKAEFATARFIIQQTILAAVNSGVEVKSHVADAVKFENALKTQQAEVRSGRNCSRNCKGQFIPSLSQFTPSGALRRLR